MTVNLPSCAGDYVEQVRQIGGQRGDETHLLACSRVTKPEFFSMEKLAAQPRDSTSNDRIHNGFVTSRSVSLVSHHRMLQPGKMHANLVRAPSFEFDVQQAESIEAAVNSIKRERDATATNDCHASAMAWIARNGLIDFTAIFFQLSVNQSDIGFENFAGAKLIGETLVRAFGFGDDHEPGSILVQAVNNAGSRFSATTRQLLKVKRQGIGQRARSDSRGRMNDHRCRLIYDDQVVVFVNNVEGNIFGLEFRRRKRGELCVDLIVGPELVRRFRGAAVDQHVLLFDQTLEPRAAPAFELFREKNVEALSGCVFRDREVKRGLFVEFGAQATACTA